MKTPHRTKRQILGQHFLASPGVLQKIVGVVNPGITDLVIEIGPGRGALTFPLAERAGKVVAVEIDPQFRPVLEEKGLPNLKIIEADALHIDFRGLAAAEQGPLLRTIIAGNIPYSISGPLFFKIVAEREAFCRAVFLVQKETAVRLAAVPGTKNYGPISILAQIYFVVRSVFAVHPGSFSPPPKVESVVISLDARPEPLVPVPDERRFARFLRSAFRQRRKTLWNNLGVAGWPDPAIRQAFGEAGMSSKIRAEQVTIAQFSQLYGFHGRAFAGAESLDQDPDFLE